MPKNDTRAAINVNNFCCGIWCRLVNVGFIFEVCYMSLALTDFLEFLRPDETASQFFSRIHQEQFKTGVRLIDRHVTLRPGVVLELCGPNGSGKTELLIQVGSDADRSDAKHDTLNIKSRDKSP